MKKLIIVLALFPSFCFAQGTRIQPGGVPTPVPIYNFQLISNNVYILVTNEVNRTGGIQVSNGVGYSTILQDSKLTNANIYSSDYLPGVSYRSNTIGQIKVSAPYTITNTLSYGFTNLHVGDNLAWGVANQVEILKIKDQHTIIVFENVQVSDTPVATNYDIYFNGAILWDVNGKQLDYNNHTHGAIATDGGLIVNTGYGSGDSQTGWSYGYRVNDGTNGWRINAIHLGTYPLYGPGLNFEVGGDNSGNPMFISALAPYESLTIFPDGTINTRSGLTNRFTQHLDLWNATTIHGDVIETNGNVSISKSDFLPNPLLTGNLGQIMYAGGYLITNTLSYGFTNLLLWENLQWGPSSQVEVVDIIDGHTVRVFEDPGNWSSTLTIPTNYAVYKNAANVYDINGKPASNANHGNGAITTDGGFAIFTGQYEAGWSYGLRIGGKTNQWRISADNLGGDPVLDFNVGAISSGNPFIISALAPYQSVWIRANGYVDTRFGFTNTFHTGFNMYDVINAKSNIVMTPVSAPFPVSGNDTELWNSNKVLYGISATKTNLIIDLR